MNLISGLPEVVFYSLASEYLTAEDTAMLACTCKDLNERVNNLGASYWIRRIRNEVKTLSIDVALKWLKASDDPDLARVSYIAFAFINWIGKNSKGQYFCEFNFLPAPVVCSHGISANFYSPHFLIDISKVWDAVSESDRTRFFELLKERLIDAISQSDRVYYIRTEILVDFIKRGLCASIMKRADSIKIIDTILDQFCAIGAPRETFAQLLTARHGFIDWNQSELDKLLETICKGAGDLALIELLIHSGANPANLPMLLHRVVSNPKVTCEENVLRTLINAGALITTHGGHTALSKVLNRSESFEKKIPLVKLLVNAGDIQTLDNKIPEILSRLESLEALQMLRELHLVAPDQKWNGKNALHLTQSREKYAERNLALFNSLLEEGVNPNERDSFGCTPLYYQIPLCKSGEVLLAMLNLFSTYGADLKNDPTLLHQVCACHYIEREESIKYLLKKGISVSAMDKDRNTPLQHIVEQYPNIYYQQRRVIKILLENGATLSEVTNANFRFFLACRFGILQEILNWQGPLPIKYNQMPFEYLTRHTVYPAITAIQSGHIDIVKYLIEHTGKDCLTVESNSSWWSIHCAVQLEDPNILREMLHLVIDTLGKASKEDCYPLVELIKNNHAELFLEVLGKFGKKFRKKFIKIYKKEIVEHAVLASRRGHHKVIETLAKIIPEEFWERAAPLILHSFDENSRTVLSKLYEKHPNWIFHTYEGKNLLETISEKLVKDKSKQSDYFELFRLVKGWIDTHPPQMQKKLYGNSLMQLFDISYEDFFLFELPVAERCELYDALFTKDAFEAFDSLGKNALKYIYIRLFLTCPAKQHWEEIKARLTILDVDFTGSNEKDGTLLDIIAPYHVNSTPQSKDHKESIAILRDMIRFAWTQGAHKGIRPKTSTPLHQAVTILHRSIPDRIREERCMQISLEFVDELIQLGHPIDIKNGYGNTPLHIAISSKNLPAAIRLIEAHADCKIKNNNGFTAGDLAFQHKDLRLIAATSRFKELIK